MNKDTLELLEQIQSDNDKDWSDGNKVKDRLARFTSYYSSLGPILARAEDKYSESEEDYETAVARSRKRGDSVAEARLANTDQAKTARELKYNYRLLFITRQSLDKEMDSMRSALTQMRHEKESARDMV